MRKMLTISAMLLASVVSSHAFPASSVTNSSGTPNVEYVANGCGIGWHRGPGGFCRRNAAVVVAPRAVVVAPAAPVIVAPVAPVVVAPRVCPPGFHLGPAGRACRPN
jgi:hypothetical protein